MGGGHTVRKIVYLHTYIRVRLGLLLPVKMIVAVLACVDKPFFSPAITTLSRARAPLCARGVFYMCISIAR